MEQFISVKCADGIAEFIGEEIFPGYFKVTGVSGMPLNIHAAHPERGIYKVTDAASFAVEQEPSEPIDPTDDEFTDGVIFDRAEYQQRADTYALGMGA